MSKNYYTIKINASNCIVEIRVNDIIVFHEIIEGVVNAVLPINHVILDSGISEYHYFVSPLNREGFSEESKFVASIWLYDCDDEVITPRTELLKKEADISQNTKIPVMHFGGYFETKVDYTIKRWSDCIELNNLQSLRDYVIHKYREIEHILLSQNEAAFISAFRQKDSEISQALCLDSDVSTRSKEIMSYTKNGYHVMPITGVELMPLWGNNRVVTLLKPDFSPALTLKNEETGELIEIEMLLGIKKGSSIFVIV